MSLFRVKTTECRVGVVGLYNSGKTVFLTSLINHIQDHDADRFPMGSRDMRVRRFTKLPPDQGWTEFNFAGNRDSLVHKGKWPAKTRDRYQFACRFERSDWTFSDCLLKLYDLPGERIADAAMGGRSYAEWSDHILGVIRDDTAYRSCCAPFLDLVGNPDATETDLVAAYKVSLANLILSYNPLVSPSTFLFDLDGKLAAPDTPEKLAAARSTGLGPESQFVPLPAPLRGTPFGNVFASRFDTYRDTVVMPFLEALKACHSLIVLVDVTMLLAGGVGMYDDTRQILRDLFRVLDPGETVLGTVGRHLAKVFLPHELRPGWITRVAFVAPKLDLVHPADRDRMLTLLKRLGAKLAEHPEGLRTEFFNCSAVVSTKPLPGEANGRSLVGVPLRAADGRKIPPGPEQRFTPSAVPDDWPLSWGPGEYAFPEVYPQVPMRKDCPPEQINLDRVLNFVTDL